MYQQGVIMFVIKIGVGYLRVQGFGYRMVSKQSEATTFQHRSDALHRANNVFGKVVPYEPD